MMKKSKIFGQLNNIKIQNKNMTNKIFSSFWATKQVQNSKQNMTKKKKNKKNIKFSQKPKNPQSKIWPRRRRRRRRIICFRLDTFKKRKNYMFETRKLYQ